jgi:hypothetical protein
MRKSAVPSARPEAKVKSFTLGEPGFRTLIKLLCLCRIALPSSVSGEGQMRVKIRSLLWVIESGALFAGLLFFVAATQLLGLFVQQETKA